MFSLLTLLISCLHTFTKLETLFIQLRIKAAFDKHSREQRPQTLGCRVDSSTTGTHGLYHWHCSIDYVRQTAAACYCTVKVWGGGGGGGGDGGRVETGGGPGGWGPWLVAQCCCRRRDHRIHTQHRDSVTAEDTAQPQHAATQPPARHPPLLRPRPRAGRGPGHGEWVGPGPGRGHHWHQAAAGKVWVTQSCSGTTAGGQGLVLIGGGPGTGLPHPIHTLTRTLITNIESSHLTRSWWWCHNSGYLGSMLHTDDSPTNWVWCCPSVESRRNLVTVLCRVMAGPVQVHDSMTPDCWVTRWKLSPAVSGYLGHSHRQKIPLFQCWWMLNYSLTAHHPRSSHIKVHTIS